MRTMKVRLAALGAAWIGISLGVVCGPAGAQKTTTDVPQMQRLVSIDARKTSLLEVVSQLMKLVHANYTLDGQLLDAPIGVIHLEKVPFHTALEIVLKASGKPATYQIENDVVMVVPRAEQVAVAPGPGQPGFVPGSAQAEPTKEVQVSVSPGDKPDQPRIRLSVQNGDLFTVFKALFQKAHVQYTLDPDLHNIYVTANINQPFRMALETLLRASGRPLTYKLENEVYSIVPKIEDVEDLITANGAPADQASIQLEVDNANLYDTLKLLFKQANVQYTLDPVLKNTFITIHVKAPFRQALETVLRAGGSFTYKVEND